MLTEELILRGLIVLGAALAVGLTVGGGLNALAALARTVLRRRHTRLERLLRYYRAPTPDALPSARALAPAVSRMPLILLAATLALALKTALTGSPLIGLFLAALGFVGQRYLAAQATQRGRRRALAAHVPRLVEAFRSAYLVESAVFPALASARQEIESPALGAALERANDAFRAGRTLDAAFAPLDELDDPYLRQFVFILRRAPHADAAAVSRALEDLARRLATRRRLAGQMRIALASVGGTTRFLGAANAAAFVAVLTMPFLWNFFTAQALIFIAASSAVAAALFYFDLRVRMLEEMAL